MTAIGSDRQCTIARQNAKSTMIRLVVSYLKNNGRLFRIKVGLIPAYARINEARNQIIPEEMMCGFLAVNSRIVGKICVEESTLYSTSIMLPEELVCNEPPRAASATSENVGLRTRRRKVSCFHMLPYGLPQHLFRPNRVYDDIFSSLKKASGYSFARICFVH